MFSEVGDQSTGPLKKWHLASKKAGPGDRPHILYGFSCPAPDGICIVAIKKYDAPTAVPLPPLADKISLSEGQNVLVCALLLVNADLLDEKYLPSSSKPSINVSLPHKFLCIGS